MMLIPFVLAMFPDLLVAQLGNSRFLVREEVNETLVSMFEKTDGIWYHEYFQAVSRGCNSQDPEVRLRARLLYRVYKDVFYKETRGAQLFFKNLPQSSLAVYRSKIVDMGYHVVDERTNFNFGEKALVIEIKKDFDGAQLAEIKKIKGFVFARPVPLNGVPMGWRVVPKKFLVFPRRADRHDVFDVLSAMMASFVR